MQTTPSSPVFSDHSDPEVSASRISAIAPLAFLAGLLASVALLNPALWIFAGLGILASALVLMKLHRAAASSTSRGLATAGLLLAILFATWAPTAHFLRRARANQQARAVGEVWFHYLKFGHANRAFGMTRPPIGRPPLNDRYQDFVRSNKDERAMYQRFVKRDIVDAIVKLGDRARVEYFQTKRQIEVDNEDHFTHWYTVTYVDENQETKTFFVEINLRRTDSEFDTKGFWQLMSSRGGFVPDQLR